MRENEPSHCDLGLGRSVNDTRVGRGPSWRWNVFMGCRCTRWQGEWEDCPRSRPSHRAMGYVTCGHLRTSTIGHWDLGCTRSLIPWALAKTVGGTIDQSRTFALSTANGTTRSLGTLVLTVYLTPECSVDHHSFIVVADTPIVLVGGDILADIFSAVHFSRAKQFHLTDRQCGLHFVGAHDPDPWGDSDPFFYRHPSDDEEA